MGRIKSCFWANTVAENDTDRNTNSKMRRVLVIKLRRLLELGICCEVMLNPKLSAGFLQERFDGRSGCDRLVGIEFGGRNLLQLSLFWIMIKIAAEQDRSSLREFQKQH